MPFMGPSPVIPPVGTTEGDGDIRVDSAVTTPASNGTCPGPTGLMGGWQPVADPTTAINVQEAATFVMTTLGMNDLDFDVESACTQVVAGTNYYLEIDAPWDNKFAAVVYQPLDSGSSMQLISLNFRE
mmetsp:Transcript_13650/g.34402  ORF Transcript_13650/g.34402 Transcript_13650/m.34402 type:complete len:128 (-) Transcript_13650:175-558(-)